MAKIKKYSVKEVAEKLGLDPQTLYRWALEHKVPCLQLGLDVRFTESNIELIQSAHCIGQLNQQSPEAGAAH